MISRRPKLPATPKDLRVVCSGDEVIVSFALPDEEAGARLTPSELDILTDLIAGCSNTEIAQRRGRSPRTIANQVASVLKKLGLGSRLEVVARAPLTR